jgi:hypothetical protein
VAARRPEKPAIDRPRRPVLVEIAAAILIVGSATDVLISFEGMATAQTALGRVLAATAVSLGVLLVLLGTFIRKGQAWLLTLNVVAVAAFLELQSLTFVGLVSGIIDMIVVGILLRERWWFQWRPPDAADVNGIAGEHAEGIARTAPDREARRA